MLKTWSEVEMKFRIVSILLLLAVRVFSQTQQTQLGGLPQPSVGSITIGSEPVTVVHLRTGYVTSIRLPEEVSSVVLGDPKAFSAEHSEAEPRLVFFKPAMPGDSQTNALITTKAGHEIPLHLISGGRAPGGGQVDFFLDYQRPRSFLVPEAAPNFVIGETKPLTTQNPRGTPTTQEITTSPKATGTNTRTTEPMDSAKGLQVSVADVTKNGSQMTVAFSVSNHSNSLVELLPPQIQLAGPSKQKHGAKMKADQIAIDEYRLTARNLSPGERADGVVTFERPSFKESHDQLFLQVAQADQVDRPTLVSIAFTAPNKRGAQ